MARPSRYSPEVGERAIRLVREQPPPRNRRNDWPDQEPVSVRALSDPRRIRGTPAGRRHAAGVSPCHHDSHFVISHVLKDVRRDAT